jgi:hypothetical protein
MRRVAALRALVAACAWCCAAAASAHVASNGFLTADVQGAEIAGSIEISVRDVELAVGVDANRDGTVTWGELRGAEARWAGYVATHLGFAVSGGTCALQFQALEINDRVDGSYAWLPFSARCPTHVGALLIRYDLMTGVDPSHRGLLTLTAAGTTQTAVLGGGGAVPLEFSIAAPDRGRTFLQYLKAGILHIWDGIDHLLFLISLLLPAVLLRRAGRWEPVPSARPALLGVLKVVTAFTLAHSITLSLAAFDLLRLPSRLTESVIAASIVVAALNNVFPLVTERRTRIAFGFGLLHGFGFASVLADMGLPAGARLTALLAFNLGIEAGQLAVVAAVMPLVYALRSAAFYRRGVMPWGSAAIAALACVWFVQRAVM